MSTSWESAELTSDLDENVAKMLIAQEKILFASPHEYNAPADRERRAELFEGLAMWGNHELDVYQLMRRDIHVSAPRVVVTDTIDMQTARLGVAPAALSDSMSYAGVVSYTHLAASERTSPELYHQVITGYAPNHEPLLGFVAITNTKHLHLFRSTNSYENWLGSITSKLAGLDSPEAFDFRSLEVAYQAVLHGTPPEVNVAPAIDGFTDAVHDKLDTQNKKLGVRADQFIQKHPKTGRPVLIDAADLAPQAYAGDPFIPLTGVRISAMPKAVPAGSGRLRWKKGATTFGLHAEHERAGELMIPALAIRWLLQLERV